MTINFENLRLYVKFSNTDQMSVWITFILSSFYLPSQHNYGRILSPDKEPDRRD